MCHVQNEYGRLSSLMIGLMKIHWNSRGSQPIFILPVYIISFGLCYENMWTHLKFNEPSNLRQWKKIGHDTNQRKTNNALFLHPCLIFTIVSKCCIHITDQSLAADESVRRRSNTRKCARWPGRRHVRRNTRPRADGGQQTSVHFTGRVDGLFIFMNSRTRIIMYFNQYLTLTGHITDTSHYVRYFVFISVEMLCVTYFTMSGNKTVETCSYRTAECERRVNETVTLETHSHVTWTIGLNKNQIFYGSKSTQKHYF